MKKDLKFIVKAVTERYGNLPNGATGVALDYDGEIRFYGDLVGIGSDFYPENLEEAQAAFRGRKYNNAIGKKYSIKKFNKAKGTLKK